MNIRDLILLALAAPTVAACPSTWNCKPDSESFSLEDEDILESDAAAVMEAWGVEDRAAVTCESVCATLYRAQTDWESSVETCEMTLSEEEGATDDAVVGTISCSGEGFEYFCEGRRPLGHTEAPLPVGGLGAHLAAAAQLEAASVTAFEQLAAQLDAWGAPADLIARCVQAAREEARHAAAVSQLAVSHGTAPRPPRMEPVPTPSASLKVAALHNAVEGCVFEAWAALSARWKARGASDAPIRATYREIAEEEAGHAQLAWDLHGWLMGQLSAVDRAEVVAAQHAAIGRLPSIAAAGRRRCPAALGLPGEAEVAQVVVAFCAGLRQAA